MSAIFFMLPIMTFIVLLLLGFFFMAARSGQFDDLENQKYRIFFDD